MGNPWLEVPLSDYEGHMGAPTVAQLEPLAEVFAEALEIARPASVAILGIAGGNGLDRIDLAVTRQIVGVDIQNDYLDAVRSRYAHLPLRLVRADLQAETLDEAPVAMVHAALVFEHAGTELCLTNAATLTAKDGFLSVVLQIPSETTAGVAPTQYASVQRFSGHFQYVDREAFSSRLKSLEFSLVHEKVHPLPGGKALWHSMFRHSESL